MKPGLDLGSQELTPRRASKKQKKTAELRPLLSARGATPAKKGAMPAPCCMTSLDALAMVGRVLAEHIITCNSRPTAVTSLLPCQPCAYHGTRRHCCGGCTCAGCVINQELPKCCGAGRP